MVQLNCLLFFYSLTHYNTKVAICQISVERKIRRSFSRHFSQWAMHMMGGLRPLIIPQRKIPKLLRISSKGSF